MSDCCCGHAGSAKSKLPLICLVPRDGGGKPGFSSKSQPLPASSSSLDEPQILDEDYIKKHFKLSKRALYLDTQRRPLITFPMTQENVQHFNMYRKTKTNQQILDGLLDASEAISAPSIFPYAKSESEKKKAEEQDEEIVYILQLPDWEYKCPVHNQIVRTPRFIWHSCKKTKGQKKPGGGGKPGGGPANKPKPWLLSRHTDFDLLSQW